MLSIWILSQLLVRCCSVKLKVPLDCVKEFGPVILNSFAHNVTKTVLLTQLCLDPSLNVMTNKMKLEMT